MIEACNRNLRGTSLNLTPYKLVRDGDSGKKCTVIYMYLQTTKMEIKMESNNPINQLQNFKIVMKLIVNA